MRDSTRRRLLLSPREIARESDVPFATVVRWIQDGYDGHPDVKLPAARLGPERSWRVRPRDFDRFFIAVSRLPEGGARRAG